MDEMGTAFLFIEMLQSEATPVERSRVPRFVWEDASALRLAVDIGPISHDNLKLANTRNEMRFKMDNESDMNHFQSDIFIFDQFVGERFPRFREE